MSFYFISRLALVVLFLGLPFLLAIRDHRRYRAWLFKTRKEEKESVVNFINEGGNLVVKKYRPWLNNWEFGEIFYAFICPLVGLFLWQETKRYAAILAFAYYPSVQLFFLISLLAYWVSRKHKHHLPLWANLLLPYGIGLGIILSALIGLHFIHPSTLFFLYYYPMFTFAFLAPIPAILYGIRQFNQQNNFVEDQLQDMARRGELSGEDYDAIHTLQWKNPAQNIALFLLMIASIQVLLLPFGQPIDALFLAFWESEDFLFSQDRGIVEFLDSFFKLLQIDEL